MNLGLRLKMLRAKKDLTQEEVLTALRKKGIDVNRITFSRWENGHQEPSLSPVLELAKIYGTTADFIISGETRRTDPLVVGEPIVSFGSGKNPERLPLAERRLLEKFSGLNPGGQKRVLEYTDMLASSGKYDLKDRPCYKMAADDGNLSVEDRDAVLKLLEEEED